MYVNEVINHQHKILRQTTNCGLKPAKKRKIRKKIKAC